MECHFNFVEMAKAVLAPTCLALLASGALAADNPPAPARALGERYHRTRAEADRAAWIAALDREGYDFSKSYAPDYGPRGIYKFNRASRIASFHITREIADRLGHDAFDAETDDGPFHFEWTRQANGAIDYRIAAPTNWDAFVHTCKGQKPANTNVACWSHLPNRGAVALSIAHHRADRAAGPYAGIPFPTNAIAAIGNFAFGVREALARLGFDNKDSLSGGTIWIGTFDSNFPGGHTDFPPHFHIIPHVRDGRQVHHFFVNDTDGRIDYDLFQDMSTVVDVWDEVRNFRRGDEIPFFDGRGLVAFRCRILPDGSGLELLSPDRARIVRVSSDDPRRGVDVCNLAPGLPTGSMRVTVTDDPFRGTMETPEGCATYDPTSGALQRFTTRPFAGTEGSGE